MRNEDYDDIDDEHYDNVFVFVCVIVFVIVFVFVIVIMVDLSTDDVAARRGWVTMSTRLCDSCRFKVDNHHLHLHHV